MAQTMTKITVNDASETQVVGAAAPQADQQKKSKTAAEETAQTTK